MKDTPEHIKALQLEIWLSKPPMERLRQMMADNEALMKFWCNAGKSTNDASECAEGAGKTDNRKEAF